MGAAQARKQEDALFRLWAEVDNIHEICGREIRDLPVVEFRTTVVIELYRVGARNAVRRSTALSTFRKAPFSKRFEDAVDRACEGASARQAARAFRLSESTVRAINPRYLERWAAARTKPALRHVGVDEIQSGRKVSDGSFEPGDTRAAMVRLRPEKETLDSFSVRT